MVSVKTFTGFLTLFTFVALAGCSQNEEPVTEAAVPVAAAPEAPQPAEAAGEAPRPSPEERAALAQAAMEKSASTAFNTATLIDPNTATPEQLAGIPGLSAEGAQAVLDNRPFATPTELHEVISEGMSEEDLFSVYSAMFVKVKLNSGAEEDFRLVPTTLSARKLAHEFEEYRPYGSIEDFRREMSKYVSEAEVAFLERYVIVD